MPRSSSSRADGAHCRRAAHRRRLPPRHSPPPYAAPLIAAAPQVAAAPLIAAHADASHCRRVADGVPTGVSNVASSGGGAGMGEWASGARKWEYSAVLAGCADWIAVVDEVDVGIAFVRSVAMDADCLPPWNGTIHGRDLV
ncbi:hypothetical protein FGB62_124g017 [Gracilaria domingensis]|nr:hypothetical protein FGB62_124g017 [Gracilaria domingensis]